MNKPLNSTEIELAKGSFSVNAYTHTPIPPNRRATDMECLREYLHATNPVTKAVCLDIVIGRLRQQHG